MTGARKTIPIACTLTGDAQASQLDEWGALRTSFLDSASIEGGMRLWFAGEVGEVVRDLAAREAACCAFLTLDVAEDGGRVRLDITSDQADALPVITGLTELAGGARP